MLHFFSKTSHIAKKTVNRGILAFPLPSLLPPEEVFPKEGTDAQNVRRDDAEADD